MRNCFFCAFALSLLLSFTAHSMPVDLSAPNGVFGASDREGGLTYSIDLQEADFGDGVKLPVRFTFGSRARGYSKYGWTGWKCGILVAGVGFDREGGFSKGSIFVEVVAEFAATRGGEF